MAARRFGLTVVVVTFDSAEHIAPCLSSVRRCLPGAQTIVVDNESRDATCDLVRERFPDVRLLRGHGNLGFGHACNLGTEHAEGGLVLYLNPDAKLVAVDREALAEMARARPFGMVAGMLAEDGGPPRSTLRRQFPHWLAEFAGVRLLGILSPLAPRPRYVRKAGARGSYTVGGAVFVVDAHEFRELGGFDERFFMYYEDTDLTERYRRAGLPLRCSQALVARHEGGASAPTPRRLALGLLGWLEYVDKWHGRAAARRAAALAHASYSAVLLSLRALAKLTANSRVSAKAEQLSAMMAEIAAEGMRARGDGGEGAGPRYRTAATIARYRFSPLVHASRDAPR